MNSLVRRLRLEAPGSASEFQLLYALDTHALGEGVPEEELPQVHSQRCIVKGPLQVVLSDGVYDRLDVN